MLCGLPVRRGSRVCRLLWRWCVHYANRRSLATLNTYPACSEQQCNIWCTLSQTVMGRNLLRAIRCVCYDIYLLTAIGLSPGGSSTVHIYTQTIHRAIQINQYIEQHNNKNNTTMESAGRAPSWLVILWHLPYN
jgi:hypothetical protein